ncbi:hypothetical protein PR048_027532 [Dryococelus australis]|uniref:Major facilitator superfamily associated domain-containing protein n=1 Tax=Dryococelus australis TaxID=614101 RepID=A0ABQ9GGT3_9NEOP|nr:hypothetical protein PR048_027532 [Dryococelus australis]
MGCLFPFLPRHMLLVGMTTYEACVVSIVAPLVAVIGPLVVSPLADRLGGRSTGRPIRTMLSVSMLAAALCYGLLMAVPTVTRMEPRLPAVSFSCNEQGAAVLQERCLQPSCTHLLDEKDQAGDATDEGSRKRRQAFMGNSFINSTIPHICDGSMCKVFTNISNMVTVNATLYPVNDYADQSEQWCRYPLSENFRCRIPSGELSSETGCKIVCDIEDPYTATGSVLAQSECPQTIGDPVATFWSYLVIRSLGDMFTTAAVTLLDASVVIATRETSIGRGDVGHELVWGSLGYAVFAPSVGAIISYVVGHDSPVYYVAFAVFMVLMLLSSIIVIFAQSMPLSPPEWWWHARGMPLSGMARSATEIGAVSAVLVLLGALWSAIDSFLPWHLTELQGTELLIGITLTVGALPAIPFLWSAEKVVEYCGHSNLLITAFTFYIIRYTGLSFFSDPWLTLVCEAFEVFTLSLMWVTAILYMRHLVPRHFTATGQAIAVIAHFCIGRFLGAIIGAVLMSYSLDEKALVLVYQVGAVAACIIASVYFIVYHCCLKPRCLRPAGPPPRNPQAVSDAPAVPQETAEQPRGRSIKRPSIIYPCSLERAGAKLTTTGRTVGIFGTTSAVKTRRGADGSFGTKSVVKEQDRLAFQGPCSSIYTLPGSPLVGCGGGWQL